MPRDLFEEAGIQPQQEPRDLFEESGINPSQNQQVSPEMYHRRQSEDTTGFKGIAQDALQSAKGLLSGLGNMALSLPGEAYGAGKQVITNPKRAASNAAAGVLGLPHTILNSPANVADYLARKQLISPHDLHVNNTPTTEEVADIFGIKGNEGGDALIRGLAEFAPGAKALKLLGTTGRVADVANAGINAAGENQDPLAAMLLGPAAEGIAKGVGKVAKLPKKLAPTNYYRGTLTPEELQRNLEITRGTNTGLGHVLDVPSLQRKQENTFPKIPFSSASETLQKVGHQVKEKGENLFNSILKGDEPENAGAAIRNGLQKAHRDIEIEQQRLFKKRDEEAEKHNVTASRFNLAKKAREILEEQKNNKELARELPTEVKKDLENYALNRPGTSLKTASILKGKIGDKAYQNKIARNKYEASIYGSLKEALESDIDHAISNSKSPNLKNYHEQANKHYQENLVPFEDPDVIKFTKKGGDTDLIVNHFLKTGKTDRPNLLRKITEKMSDKELSLFAHSYFSPSLEGGNFNPTKFKKLFDDLSDKQKQILFRNPEMKKQFEDFSVLAHKNQKSLYTMHNPPTGQQGVDVMTSLLHSALTGVGGLAGGISGAATGLIAPMVSGNIANRLITSEPFRERFVKKIIKKETKGEPLTKTERAMAEFTKHLNKTPAALRKAAPALELELNQYAGQEEQA